MHQRFSSICIILVLAFKVGFAQQVDTSLVLKHLKLRLLSELPLGSLSENALNDYFNRELQATILKSKGFDDLVFFKISNQILAVDTISESNKIVIFKMPVCLKISDECYFVYAYDKVNKGFYRLKSTHTNEFIHLYNGLQESWIWWRPVNKIRESTIDQFTKDYWIEGLDLACLLRSLKSKQGECLDYFSPEMKAE